jgi:CTP synthase
VVEKLRLEAQAKPADLSQWQAVVDAKANPTAEVDIAMVGKYVQIRDSYISLNEALTHAGVQTRTRVRIHFIDSTDIEERGTALLEGMDAILVPGGFGERGIEGKIAAIKHARERGIPYLGICLGMQLAVIEYGRNVLGLDGANSTEFNRSAPHPVIALITEWQDAARGAQARDESSAKGGTMRLGAQDVDLAAGSRARTLYGRDRIRERHRHRYEFNSQYRNRFEAAGFLCSGTSPDKRLVEFIELTDHPFWVGTQAHPEFKSRPDRPHPLFRDMMAASLQYRSEHRPQVEQVVADSARTVADASRA